MKLSRRSLLQATSSLVAAQYLTAHREAHAQTPEAGVNNRNDLLREFASFVPLSIASENAESGGELFTFGDFALRLSRVGLDLSAIEDLDERRMQFGRATQPVPAAELVSVSFRSDDPLALFGWRAADIDQSAFVMSSEGTLTILRGRWNADDIRAAWEQHGYTSIDLDGFPVASLAADATIDVTSELGRLTLSKANNAALVDDQTILYASTLEQLRQMIQATRGEIDSLASLSAFATLIAATPVELAGASILPAGAFITSPIVFGSEQGIDVLSTWEPGPVPLLGLVGFASGTTVPDNDLLSPSEPEPSGSRQIAVRHFLTEAEAIIAAKRTLLNLETQGSVMTGQPWTELFAGWRIWTDAPNRSVISDIDLYANEGVWSRGIYSRDAWYLYS